MPATTSTSSGRASTGAHSSSKTKPVSDALTTDTVVPICDLLLNGPKDGHRYLVQHQLEPMNQCMEEKVPQLLAERQVFYESLSKTKKYVNYLKFTDCAYVPPMVDDEPMMPQDARKLGLSYNAKIVCHVEQWLEITDIATGQLISNTKIGEEPEHMNIGNIPIMVRSNLCNLIRYPTSEKLKDESPWDYGGYFIVHGNEKVLVTVESVRKNRILVYPKKDAGEHIFSAQVSSRDLSLPDGVTQMVSVTMKKNNELIIRMPKFNEFSVFAAIRALGVVSDNDIISICINDPNDKDMLKLLRNCMEKNRTTSKRPVLTNSDALNLMADKLTAGKRITETDRELRNQQRRQQVLRFLQIMLPHVKGGYRTKALYLGRMINKLLSAKLGRTLSDDRDSFVNKSFETSGELFEQKIQESIHKLLKECERSFSSRNNNIKKPVLIIDVIRPTTIEQGVRQALTSGTWGKKKKGISHVLPRLSFLQTLSYLRMLVSPTIDASTNKLTSPRHYHNSQAFYACCVESPDGHKIGLVKNMAIGSTITISKLYMVPTIKRIIREHGGGVAYDSATAEQRAQWTLVLINGCPYQYHESVTTLENTLRFERTGAGKLEWDVGVSHNRRLRELNIACEGGRPIRPVFRVDDDNALLITRDMLAEIAHNLTDVLAGKIATFAEFQSRYPGVIDWLDTEEAQYSMIATNPADINTSRTCMNRTAFTKLDEEAARINRFNKYVFKRYTHCEIHPLFAVGVVTCNTPLFNHNQAPRNVFQYGYARQTIGLFISNWRKRMDISYLAHYPERSLVSTHGQKWTGVDMEPAGENCIVAIMSRKGYNVEDSQEVNQDAIDRGQHSAVNFKKVTSEQKKNASVSRDDEFMKPDSSEVADMGDNNYGKLTVNGYVPRGTEIVNGDAVIGKGTPIAEREGGDHRRYRDASEIFKSNVPAYVDDVWTDLTTAEGYKLLKMRIRMDRELVEGDKLGSRHGQKGCIGMKERGRYMPYIERNGMQISIIINPHAIPSRMSIAQLHENRLSMLGALHGRIYDGSAFSQPDMKAIGAQLEAEGFAYNGHEIVRDGLTGERYNVPIYVGFNYYQRLKHLVLDKVHARAEGRMQVLTRQPNEGRAKDGALRIGEMERDALISNGLSQFLQECFMNKSDAFVIFVCDICNLFAAYSPKRRTHKCPACDNSIRISKIVVPASFKLLIQEVMSMSACLRIFTDKVDKLVNQRIHMTA